MSSADVINAEIMGGMFGPNQYSQFPGRVPQPGYVGTPTDATGRPIAPPPGMTLNSMPAAPAVTGTHTAPSGGMSGGAYGDWRSLAGPSPGGPDSQAQWAYNLGLGGIGPAGSLNPGGAAGRAWAGANQVPNSAPAAPAQPPGTGDLNSALSLLANPGHVTTPGATVPQSSPTANQPDVLSSFLASQGGGQGAGGYDNSSFFSTLNALKSGMDKPAPTPQGQSGGMPNPGSNLASSFAPVSAPGAAPVVPPPPAPAPAPSVGGLGGLGGMPSSVVIPAPRTPISATASPFQGAVFPWQMTEQNWRGMGSGNGGAAGNGSAGGQ